MRMRKQNCFDNNLLTEYQGTLSSTLSSNTYLCMYTLEYLLRQFASCFTLMACLIMARIINYKNMAIFLIKIKYVHFLTNKAAEAFIYLNRRFV